MPMGDEPTVGGGGGGSFLHIAVTSYRVFIHVYDCCNL